MKCESIQYQHNEVELEAHLAYDDRNKNKRPLILVFHAWSGRDRFVCERAEQLAALGYVGCALDIYGKGVLGKDAEESSQLMEPFIKDRKLLLDRIKAGVTKAKSHPMVDSTQLGAIGFCFGGLCALDLARSGMALQGIVSFHGLLHPPQPLKQEKIQAKILVCHGHEDPMVSPEEVLAFEREMTAAQVDWQVHVYGQTFHAFTKPEVHDPKKGLIYSETAAKRSFQSMKHFFEEIYQ